jgi:hypothetical protein
LTQACTDEATILLIRIRPKYGRKWLSWFERYAASVVGSRCCAAGQ